MKYAYYPGCSAHSTARDMHESVLAVAKVLGIDLIEIKGWTCCGATAAHQTDRRLASSLAAANLVQAKKMGMEMAVSCAACYNRSKTANYEVVNDPEMREKVADFLGEPYDGSVAVRHLVELIVKDIGLPKLKKKIKYSLKGLKVASYYGCYLLRPAEVTNFDNPENPTILEDITAALGGEPLEWQGKVDCCGGSHSLAKTDLTVRRSGTILEMAADAGADFIATACPMCQSSLDLRQSDIEKAAGRKFNIPVLYITQMLGLCLGIEPGELGMNRLMVDPAAIIMKIREN